MSKRAIDRFRRYELTRGNAIAVGSIIILGSVAIALIELDAAWPWWVAYAATVVGTAIVGEILS